MPEDSEGGCPIIIKASLEDDEQPCGAEIPEAMAGLCEVHYKEYLTTLIKNQKIDPLDRYEIVDCQRELGRNLVPYNDNATLEQLKTLITEQIPLLNN